MSSSEPSTPVTTAPRLRALTEVPTLAAQAVSLLHTPEALFGLSLDEAKGVVGYMRLVTYPKGATLLREGDGKDANEMLLLLDGEVSVDAGTATPSGSVAIASLGPGSVLGEVALLDGRPRSAQCTALSPVRAGGLSRRALEQMLETQPRIAAKLMTALSQRIAERLRAMGQQLQMYGQLTESLQAEVDRLRAARR
jgi:CRP/FNR family transcriptional regulator, cyclic AMP receptor protein